MSNFVPEKVFLWGVLLHYFNMKKTAAESHRILVAQYLGIVGAYDIVRAYGHISRIHYYVPQKYLNNFNEYQINFCFKVCIIV